MIESFHVPKAEVGKWVGIFGSVFSLCQFLTAVAWGRISDHYGRKSAILAGLAIPMITSLWFGFTKTLAVALTIRAISGLGNGNGGIVRTVAAELVPQRELQPRAFSILPLIWTAGSMLGPAMGGLLADPARKYPSSFGKLTFFHQFPFALPNIFSTLLYLAGIVIGYLFLRETLPRKTKGVDRGRKLGKALVRACIPRSNTYQHTKRTTTSETNEPQERPVEETDPLLPSEIAPSKATKSDTPFRWRDVFTSQSNMNLLQYGMLGMHSVAFDHLLPTFLHSTAPEHSRIALPFRFLANFGLDSGRIGIFLMINGIIGIFMQVIVFPPIAKRYGVLTCLKAVAVSFPGLYLLMPYTALIPNTLGQQVTVFILVFIKNTLAMFAFPCGAIMITNSATSSNVLGTLNGVSTSVGAVGRAIGPGVTGYMFTVGVTWGTAVLPWWIMAMMAAIGAIPIFFLEEKVISKEIGSER